MVLRKTFVGVLFAAIVLFAAGCSGSEADIDAARVETVREGMRTMVEETAAGRLDAGEDAFWEVHPFFHDVDPALREADWPLAAAMWNSMLQIEMQYAGDRDAGVLVKEGRASLEMLPKVAEALGLEVRE